MGANFTILNDTSDDWMTHVHHHNHISDLVEKGVLPLTDGDAPATFKSLSKKLATRLGEHKFNIIHPHDKQLHGKFPVNKDLTVEALRVREEEGNFKVERLMMKVKAGARDNGNIDFSMKDALEKNGVELVHEVKFENKSADWGKIAQKIASLVRNEKMGPPFLRLSFHDSATFHRELGKGGGGTVRFLLPDGKKPDDLRSLPQHAGLARPIKALEPIKAKFDVSWADILQFAAVVTVKVLGGPSIPFRPGRTDLTEKDADEIIAFYQKKYDKLFKHFMLPKPNWPDLVVRMYNEKYGFGIRQIVTLNGAHCLGGTNFPNGKKARTWTNTPQKFSNQYFVNIRDMEWPAGDTIRANEAEDVKGTRLIWREKEDTLVLLETDFILKTNLSRVSNEEFEEFKKVGEEYAADENLFFNDFADTFSKLSDMGWNNLGELVNLDNVNLQTEE
jgi:hypothetical protein